MRREYYYLKPTDNIQESSTPLHVRLIKPPGMKMRKQFADSLQGSNNFGLFKYHGKDHKSERCGSVLFSVDVCGMKINDDFVPWRQVKEVSFSHTYLQILTQQPGESPVKTRICFSASKTKFIYDLVVFLIEANKEVERTKAKELSNLDDLCDQLMKITKTAMTKVMTTPQRKRTKTLEGSASKKQRLNPSLGFSEKKRKPLASVSASQYQYQYKLYLENEEDEIYVHMDQLKRHRDKENIIPRIKTRITTNPNLKTQDLKPNQPLQPRPGPVIMGTTTLKRKMTNNFESEQSKKIVCVSLSKMEYLSLKVGLTKSEDNITIEKLINQPKKKLLIGDKIIAVNGKTLENISLEKANFIISNSGHLLNFILQRF